MVIQVEACIVARSIKLQDTHLVIWKTLVNSELINKLKLIGTSFQVGDPLISYVQASILHDQCCKVGTLSV